MHKLIVILCASALMLGCSQESGTGEADSEANVPSTVKDNVSDSEYSKKYGAAMKQAMSKKEKAEDAN